MSFKSEAIREYRFTAGSLVADANGNLSTFSNQGLNGIVRKIIYEGGNYTKTGSIQILTSGAVIEQFIIITSGTAVGNVGSNMTLYPFVYGQGQNGVTGSPYTFNFPHSFGPIQLIGSGLGAGASGLSITVHYY